MFLYVLLNVTYHVVPADASIIVSVHQRPYACVRSLPSTSGATHSGRTDLRVTKLWRADSEKLLAAHQFWRHQGRSATTVFDVRHRLTILLLIMSRFIIGSGSLLETASLSLPPSLSLSLSLYLSLWPYGHSRTRACRTTEAQSGLSRVHLLQNNVFFNALVVSQISVSLLSLWLSNNNSLQDRLVSPTPNPPTWRKRSL